MNGFRTTPAALNREGNPLTHGYIVHGKRSDSGSDLNIQVPDLNTALQVVHHLKAIGYVNVKMRPCGWHRK